MLRAIRFSCQLNFKIDQKSIEGIKLERIRIKIISQERITDEINKILMTKKPSIGFRALDNTGLLELIFPELNKLKELKKYKD